MAKKRNSYFNSLKKRLPGTTTVTGCMAKEALIPWAAKEAAEHVRKKWEPGIAYEQDYIEVVLQDAKNAHRVRKETAGEFGSDKHELIESYITNQITIDTLSVDEDKRALENFMIVTKGWKFVGSEIIVVNEELGYGGTADIAAYDQNGMEILPDIKTSSGVYPEFDLQLAMYALATPVDPVLHEFWEKMREHGEGRIIHYNKERNTWEVLERNLKEHYPYIPHICKMYNWKKTYSPSYS